jgi:glycosyltransferase involved in cell wall biosynthesis
VRLRLVPNVVDVAAIEPVAGSIEARRVIFVASFAYEPNRTGLRFLLDEVLPLVWRELPDVRLSLVGGGLEHPPSEDPRVQALGFVDDLAAAYASATCAVVPLLQGGGTPLKFIEALAYGLPVIATSRAAAGLDVVDGEHCLIADRAADFAQALVGVLRRRGRDRRARPRAGRAALLDPGAASSLALIHKRPGSPAPLTDLALPPERSHAELKRAAMGQDRR